MRAVDSLSSSPDSMEPRRIAAASASELGQVDDARVHLSYGALQDDPYSPLRFASAYEEAPSPVLLNVAPTPAYRLGGLAWQVPALGRAFQAH